MTDKLADAGWIEGVLIVLALATMAVLPLQMGCRDDLGVALETNPPAGCDSVICRLDTVYRDTGSTVFDTVIVTVVDTVYVWCIRVERGHYGKPDIYECDNGYRGPITF